MKATGGPLLAAGVAVGLFAAPVTLPFTTPAPSGEGIAPASSGSNDPPPEDVGFWPSVTEEDSEELCTELSNMRWQAPVAAAFVGDALGWSNTAERDVRRIADDVIHKQQGNFPSTFIGGGTPDSPWITLELSRMDGPRCWWVTGVSDPDDDAEFSVTLRQGSLDAIWDMAPDATRADLLVVESNGRRELIPGEEGATSTSVDGFEGPGFALLLWKGEDGTVVSASGITLPDGDHSATSP